MTETSGQTCVHHLLTQKCSQQHQEEKQKRQRVKAVTKTQKFKENTRMKKLSHATCFLVRTLWHVLHVLSGDVVEAQGEPLHLEAILQGHHGDEGLKTSSKHGPKGPRLAHDKPKLNSEG